MHALGHVQICNTASHDGILVLGNSLQHFRHASYIRGFLGTQAKEWRSTAAARKLDCSWTA